MHVLNTPFILIVYDLLTYVSFFSPPSLLPFLSNIHSCLESERRVHARREYVYARLRMIERESDKRNHCIVLRTSIAL